MSNLYQDAILDAKALRASAMANAKAALEEAFEPKIQEMIAKHLSEEEEAGMEEGYGMEEEGKEMEEEGMMKHEEGAEINEQELEEILNQLEELEKTPTEESLNEAEEEEEEEEEEEGEDAAEGEEEVSDETKVIDITLGDLKQVIQSLMPGQEMPAAEEEPTADSEAEAEVSLDEILDELANEGMEEEGAESVHDVTHNGTGYAHGKQSHSVEEEGVVEESAMSNVILALTSILAIPGVTALLVRKFGKNFVDDLKKGGGVALKGQPLDTKVGMEDKPANEGLIKESAMTNVMLALSAVIGIPGVAAYLTRKFGGDFVAQLKKEKGVALKGQPLGSDAGVKNELAQAKETIAELRKDLQEVNLLNAKYLYMNKIFKGKSLTESQKLKVINALDRATSVKEVKNTYETIRESFESKKGQLKESIGFASKPAGVAPKANIVESEQFVSRWQKLAGIK